ncbi:pyruvate kinase [bacterium]|nr:pyruvate kinase [bacterium]
MATLFGPGGLPQKRTKIVCTIGPASRSMEVLKKLALNGADVFRLNFSHGTHEDHAGTIAMIRELSRELSAPFAILADLSGPKLRIGEIEGGSTEIAENECITLSSAAGTGGKGRFTVNFSDFHRVAQPGEVILLDDGKFSLVVETIEGQDVKCRVLNGGTLKSRKGVNLPDTRLPIPALTAKDQLDLKFALDAGVDVVALSFVRSPDDIYLAKAAMTAAGRTVPLLAKIEKKEAVDRLGEIIRAADGAMVARGDLGIEIPMEQVPAVQKRIIHICNQLAKPVITATQMLESMISSPQPTRAEVTDIYNAILDGTDAVMLSAETASGQYPARTVEVMDNVAGEAEKAITWNKGCDWIIGENDQLTTTHVVCNSAVMIAERLKLDLIIVPTYTGYSAFQVSRFKPSVPIFACSEDPGAVNAMCLAWGVTPRVMGSIDVGAIERSATDALIEAAVRTAKHYGIARSGMRAAVLGGVPLGRSQHTNFLRVIEIP